MKNKKETEEILDKLKEEYPYKKGFLKFKTPFELTIAVLLSAQATDKMVNKVTENFFKIAGNPEKLSKLSIDDIKKYISSINFYNNKAKNIYNLNKILLEKYNGKIPENMEDLMKLPGIGRKSANVIMLEAFKKPQGVAIDTHAKRICKRLGITKNDDPEKVEKDLLKKIDYKYYFDANYLFVMHGREICMSRKPKCENCPVSYLCDEYNKNLEKNI